MTNQKPKKLASRVRCTVAVVGDSRSGKTALVRRFAAGQFKEVGRRLSISQENNAGSGHFSKKSE